MPGSNVDYFVEPFHFCGKRIRGRFVVPSGIRCTHGSVIAKCFREVNSIGIITTKSISAAPRVGYREPIYARYSSGSYINAVGLANPGAEQLLSELEDVVVPPDKFLLVSIFGADEDEFVRAAEKLRPVADGFELNMSCPHASGYGIQIGQDTELLRKITSAVCRAAGVPVIVKLSATLPRLAETAKVAIESGATGIAATNTIGPSMVSVGTVPILHNRVGGLSGNAIRPLGVHAVGKIRAAIGPAPVIIGMGGIGTAEHVLQVRAMGANVFGIGSAVTGLDSQQFQAFFADLESSLLAGEPVPLGSDGRDTQVTMQYQRCRIVGRKQYSDRLFEMRVDRLPGDPAPGQLAGQYYFLCIPEVGEKPFAVFSAAERSFVVKSVGLLTGHLSTMTVGEELLIRGPYGKPFSRVSGVAEYILVGGGTGTASLLEIGVHLRSACPVQFVVGARTASELFGIDELQTVGPTHIATDDGTAGFAGTASGLLDSLLCKMDRGRLSSLAFVNCGPEPMIHACAALQQKHVPEDRIIAAVEYLTSCGVGVCGKCASPSGHLSCIDGPFMPIQAFRKKPARKSAAQPACH